MMPSFRLLAALCLLLATASTNAQNFLTPLNGPNGIEDIELMAADSTGAIYLALKDQIYRSEDGGDIWADASEGWNSPYISKFFALPSGKMFAQGNSGLYRYHSGANSWVYSGLSGAIFALDGEGRLWSSNASIISVSNDDGATLAPVLNYNRVAAGTVSRLAPY